MDFYSHPDKRLIDHLIEVKQISEKNLDDNYKKAGEILGYCHDFGKYTTYFQNYLFSSKKVKSQLSSHGFISALLAASIALKEYGEHIMPLIIYNCVLHHHGSVENASLDLPKRLKGIDEIRDNLNFIEKLETAYEQVKDIEKNSRDIYEDYKSIGYEEYVIEFITKKPFEETLKKLKKIDFQIISKKEDSEYYFLHQLLYGALISADKISASNLKVPEINYIEFNKLDEYRKQKFRGSTGEINRIRSEIFDNIQYSIGENYSKSKIFSITSPTGTGKTYSGFFAALKLRELTGGNRKIIYALPFTSIINQNYDSIYALFGNVENFEKISSSYILKHHSLADVEYSQENEDYSKVQAEMLIENWNSGIIITTFVQLLQTLIGNKNRMLKKFGSLKDSIILLDEVQAIDIKFYKLVDYILRGAAEYLGCRIIMMTATRPLMLQDGHELLKDNKKYFDLFNRTIIIPKIRPITMDDFVDEFYENLEDKSYLIICNTISQSLELYKRLKGTSRDLMYLSTNLLPIHRKERIQEIKDKLEAGENPLLISTQVVEAGVDFDFDIVIRDIGPIDSIIQAAGRCNRHGKCSKPGHVYIYSMVNEAGRYYGSLVYGTSLINISKGLLEDKKEIQESDYFELIEAYFQEVNRNINKDDSDKFIISINKLLFSKADEEEYSINKFSLIKENHNYIDVYFRINDEAEAVYNKLLKAMSEKNLDKKNEMFLQIKNKIRDYTLSLPIKYINKFNREDIVINLPEEGCADYYNEHTGFIRDDKDEFFIM